jgi:predicted molibdopterin-dependent oxidoreductase YjgC
VSISADIPAPQYDGPTGGDSFFLVPFVSHSLGAGEGAPQPWLQGAPDPTTSVVWHTWVEMNVHRAEEMGLRTGDWVRVEGPRGAIEAMVYLSPATPRDVVAIPLGGGHEEMGRYARNRGANVLALLTQQVEAETGALAWASSRVAITKLGRIERLSRAESFHGIIREPHEGAVIQVTNGAHS